MGISELVNMESEETKKKFSPFSVDSLLATKVKQPEGHQNNNSQIVDLSVKKEEEESDTEVDYEEEDDLEDCDDDLEETETDKPTVLTPNPRFPLGVPLGALPTPTSAAGFFNPMGPWLPQFRSPLNPFLASE